MGFRKKIKKEENIEVKIKENKNEEIKKEEQVLVNDSTTNDEETKVEEIKTTGEENNKPKSKSIRKGSKIIANGRCFGSENLECPLKSVKNYETKILEISKDNVLIDEGWISKKNIEVR